MNLFNQYFRVPLPGPLSSLFETRIYLIILEFCDFSHISDMNRHFSNAVPKGGIVALNEYRAELLLSGVSAEQVGFQADVIECPHQFRFGAEAFLHVVDLEDRAQKRVPVV